MGSAAGGGPRVTLAKVVLVTGRPEANPYSSEVRGGAEELKDNSGLTGFGRRGGRGRLGGGDLWRHRRLRAKYTV